MASGSADLVRAMVPGPDVDLATLLRDDGLFNRLAESLSQLVAPDAECTAMWQAEKSYRGIEGFRELWLDWIEPWSGYRVGIDELIDLDESILVLARDHATRDDTDREFELLSASLWEFEDGRLKRLRFFRNRDEAMRAVGLS